MTFEAYASEAARGLSPSAAVHAIEPLLGGHSSLTYTAILTGVGDRNRRIVLKVAPEGVAPVKDRDVLRHARLLRALAPVPGVSVPVVLFEWVGDPPGVPPFFAMDYVEGDSVEPLVDATDDPPPDVLAERALAAMSVLAVLHSVDPAAVGLDEPAIALDAEVERWRRAFASVSVDLALDGPALADRLLAGVPDPVPARIVHGDYRLGNMRCEGAAIRAVVDWEIWGIGDGRLDLAWFLLMLDPGYPSRTRNLSEMPSTDVLQSAYEQARGRPVGDMTWFHAFVRFKQAAATALITKRARTRRDVGFPESVGRLLASASERLPDQRSPAVRVR